MHHTTRFAALLFATFAFTLPACQGNPAPGDPLGGDDFAAGEGDRAGDLEAVCAAFCEQQDACGTAGDACLDDCQYGDVVSELSLAADVAEEPVPSDCADAYVGAIDCLATPTCDEGTTACDASVASYADCKLELVSG